MGVLAVNWLAGNWSYDDGGRAAAGFKGHTTDCSCRAISIAMQRPYGDVYADLNTWGAAERVTKRRKRPGSARTGVRISTLHRYMAALGWTWTPTMHIGQGTTVHLRASELPLGRLIVQVSRHLCAVVDGVVHDTGDPSRNGQRCVYGYWSKP
jgi:hypothetical protein